MAVRLATVQLRPTQCGSRFSAGYRGRFQQYAQSSTAMPRAAWSEAAWHLVSRVGLKLTVMAG